MANAFFNAGVDATFKKQVDWVNDDIRVIGLSAAYVADLVTHDNLDDISTGRITSAVSLTGKTFSARNFTAAALLWTAVTGSPITQVVILKWTGTESTSTLLYYIDSATNLPITPVGSDVSFTPDPIDIFKVGA